MENKNLKKNKPTILCLSDFYLPEFKSGGLVRSLSNFVKMLGDDFNIKIICRNIENRNIKANAWITIGKAKVFYIINNNFSIFSIINLVRKSDYDILYLNSVFSFRFTILPLLVRIFSNNLLQSCVISPRGELATEALSLKKFKKYLFLKFAKPMKFYDNVIWIAGRQKEYFDIYKVFGKKVKKVKIIPDHFSFDPIPKKLITKKNSKILKIVFLSRITPIKNLDFLLSILLNFSEDCELNIFGPIDDKKYWKKCENIISKLPENIRVKIGKAVKPHNVQKFFSKYDLFAFPTRGESFGHVIFEALSSGTPVLLSDQTMWKSDKKKGIIVVPLNKKSWLNELKKMTKLTPKQFYSRKKAALHLANKKINNLKNKEKLFNNFFFKISKL